MRKSFSPRSLGLVMAPVRKPRPKGTVGDESDSEFADGREDFVFYVALPERVFGLEGGDGVDFVGSADGCGGGFGEAEVFDLACFYEVGHRAYGVFDGGLRVDAVLVVEVDVVDAEALEGCVAGGFDVLWLAADGPVGWVFFFADVGEFCCEEDLVAAWADGFADQLFVVADAVGVGGVEEVDSEIERAEEGCGRLFVVALAVELAHAHATESHAGDDCAL